MSGLICRTRGDRSPQGLPKVYLAIHPGDREGYLEEFVGLLLELQSMSVWYPEDPEMVRTEEVMDDLARMSLFVVPVTTRLLTAPDPVLTEELRFAGQKHIPVLPVVVEQGLEELYERRFGDLQFLDRNAKDETVMSFRQKLERYLSSVLIGDQLTKRIRDAFGACMFLSYRKKDRKYAQELMRSVHSHEACRDIGIWYDEFLIPGEGFNDAIRAALERSKLFLMAVTPNLVDEDNYVVTEEYPAARKAEKPVLPVELVSTDRAALEEAFEQIPPCVDARDPEGFRRALMAAVEAMEIRKRDRSPEHDYLIGLAYLRGVDVEVDHDRAVELIHGAAEAGLPEAARRLVQMYLTGDGVERDYQQAVRWQEQVVSCCEETHGQDRGLFSHEVLTGALLECGHQYMAMERLEEAERMY
jgi:hypothetical protein